MLKVELTSEEWAVVTLAMASGAMFVLEEMDESDEKEMALKKIALVSIKMTEQLERQMEG